MDILEASAAFGYGAMPAATECYICARPTGASLTRSLKPPHICSDCQKRLTTESFGPRLGYDEEPAEPEKVSDTREGWAEAMSQSASGPGFKLVPVRVQGSPVSPRTVPCKAIPGAVWVLPPGPPVAPVTP